MTSLKSFKNFLLSDSENYTELKIALKLYKLINESDSDEFERDMDKDNINPNNYNDTSEINDDDPDFNAETNELKSKESVSADDWFQGLKDKIYSNRKSKAKGKYYNYKTAGAVQKGRMYAFRYRPNNHNSLSYYDETPLVIPFEFKETKGGHGFLGVNLHYIPRRDRKKVIEYLISNDPEQTEEFSSVEIDYLNDVKNNFKFKSVYYAVRHYLLDNIVGALYVVPNNDFLNVIDLYSAKYVGMSESGVMATIRADYNKIPRPKIVKTKSSSTTPPVKKDLSRIKKIKKINSIGNVGRTSTPTRKITGNLK